MEVIAEGTEETKIPFLELGRPVEMSPDKFKDGYLVS
jgi:hypothetical protein